MAKSRKRSKSLPTILARFSNFSDQSVIFFVAGKETSLTVHFRGFSCEAESSNRELLMNLAFLKKRYSYFAYVRVS